MSADLPVPDEAMAALRRCASVGRYADDEACDEDVRAVAGPVVAAELRRLVHEWRENHRGASAFEMQGEMLARATEIEGQT